MTKETLQSLFVYDPEGFLVWRDMPANRGDLVGGRAGWVQTKPYPRRKIQIGKQGFYEHRLIYIYHFGPIRETVDHINGNTLDNRIENLRPASMAENLRNRKRQERNKSGFKGVAKTKGGRFTAFIRFNHEGHHLGTFDKIEQAAKAYEDAAKKLHGDFATTRGSRSYT